MRENFEKEKEQKQISKKIQFLEWWKSFLKRKIKKETILIQKINQEKELKKRDPPWRTKLCICENVKIICKNIVKWEE